MHFFLDILYLIIMAGFLFHEIIFGPVYSRRLGTSLGINLLPTDVKICSFNCVYCECGWTYHKDYKPYIQQFPPAALVEKYLEQKLREIKAAEEDIDSITYAGNGEPTLHPEFAQIMDIIVRLRNQYFPQSVISVLSNSSMLFDDNIINAIKKADNNILKLDAGTDDMVNKINHPLQPITVAEIVKNLKKFDGKLIIQTLFLRANFNGTVIDNTTEEEISLWLGHLKEINPEYVMIYPIARGTPLQSIEKLSVYELEQIAKRVEALGIKTKVYG